MDKKMNNSDNNLVKTCYDKRSGGLLPQSMIFNNEIDDKIVDEKEKWFNTTEASKFLRISPNALRILVHRAKIKAYKLGSRLRFKKSDLLLALQLKED